VRVLDPVFSSTGVLVQEQPVALAERLPDTLNFAPRYMAGIVALGCDPRIRVEKDQLRAAELSEVLRESLGVLGAAMVGEGPVDDRDAEAGNLSC
jgi:hypothetical protein